MPLPLLGTALAVGGTVLGLPMAVESTLGLSESLFDQDWTGRRGRASQSAVDAILGAVGQGYSENESFANERALERILRGMPEQGSFGVDSMAKELADYSVMSQLGLGNQRAVGEISRQLSIESSMEDLLLGMMG